MTIPAPEYYDFVRARFNFLPDPGLGMDPTTGPVLTSTASLLHAAIGLTGEVAEFGFSEDTPHEREELGDIEFYLAAARIVCADSPAEPRADLPNPIPDSAAENPFNLLTWYVHEFQDLVKKEWAYNKPRNRPALLCLLDGIETALLCIYEEWHFDRDDILAANIGKLLKRYPTGYSDAAAQARADKEA